MPHKLTDMHLEEISLVDKPANKEARRVLFKRDGPVDKADGVSCPTCGVAVNDRVALQAHKAKMHPSKSPIIDKANSSDDSGDSGDDSSDSEETFDCPECGDSFDSQSALEQHIESEHPDAVEKIGKLGRMMLAVSKTLGLKSEEEEVAKDTLLFIDDDDDIVSDLRQLLGIDPPEEGEDDPLAQLNPGTPLYQVADALSVLGKIEKAGKKISADRMNRLKEAHGKLGQVIGEVDQADAPDEANAGDSKKPGATGAAKSPTKKGKDGNMTTLEELTKQVTDLQAENEELRKAADDAPEEEDIFKGLTPAAAEKLRGEMAKSEAMEKRIAKMEDERESAVFTKQATDLGLSNDFGPVLKRFSKNQSTPEDMEQLTGLFKAYNEAGHLAEVMREIGKGGAPGGTTAWDSIVAKGDEIRKADPSLSVEQARKRAIEIEPSLKAEYDAERTSAA